MATDLEIVQAAKSTAQRELLLIFQKCHEEGRSLADDADLQKFLAVIQAADLVLNHALATEPLPPITPDEAVGYDPVDNYLKNR